MSVLSVPVEKLRAGQEYQRGLESHRVAKILESISQNGYWPWSAIVVNQDLKIIDGQHRVEAAKQIKLKEVPVCMVMCKNEKEEAGLFSKLNSFNTRLRPADFWHARFLIGHPVALLIYRLNNDPSALCFNKVAVKGHGAPSRLPVSSFLNILIGVLFDCFDFWTLRADEGYCRRIVSLDYCIVLSKINKFFGWFFDSFGNDPVKNRLAYTGDSLRVAVELYRRILKTGAFQDSRSSSHTKMRTFFFPPEWKRVGHSGRLNMFIVHWNENRRKYKVKYGEEEE